MSTVKELTEEIREDFLDDTERQNPLWSDRTIARALNQSQREIAERCLLLTDSTTNEICFLNLAIDPATGKLPQTIPLNSKVLRVEFVLFPHFDNQVFNERHLHNYQLTRTSTAKMNDHSRSEWGFERGWIGRIGRVERFMTDFQYKSLTFDHVPLWGGTVQIGVIRLPLVNLTAKEPENEPEIKEYNLALIHGALKYAYSKGFKREDSETHDPIKESRWKNQFEEDIRQIQRDKAVMSPDDITCRPEGWDEGRHWWHDGFGHRGW
jgi:hypothetical protein